MTPPTPDHPSRLAAQAVTVACAVLIGIAPAFARDDKESNRDPALAALAILPLNQKSTGLTLPEFDEDGNHAGQVHAGTATRINDEEIALENLYIEVPSEPLDDLLIQLPEAVYNVANRMLIGTRDTLVWRSDFVLTGDRLEFNTRTRAGVVKGNIKMVIHQRPAPQQPGSAPNP